MLRLSIVIPATAAQGDWEDTLASVLTWRPEGCEVIVAYAGAYTDPYGLADEVRFLSAPSEGGLLGCLNVGTTSARGEIVHLLSPGVLATEGWVEPALAAFAGGGTSVVAPLVACQQDPEQVLAAGVRYRASGQRVTIPRRPRHLSAKRIDKLRVSGPTLLAGFYRHDALRSLGGFEEAVGERLADVELALRLVAGGYRCRLVSESRVLSGKLPEDEPASFTRGRLAERLFWRAAPLAGWRRSLLLHPAAVLLEWAANIHRPGGWTQLLGRAMGALERKGHRRDRVEQRQRVESATPPIHALPAAEGPAPAALKQAS